MKTKALDHQEAAGSMGDDRSIDLKKVVTVSHDTEKAHVMKAYCGVVSRISETMYGIAGVMLVIMMLLTTTDVIMRMMGNPLPGTYELVGLMGAVVIGFAIPQTSLLKGHVYVEFLIDRFDPNRKAIVLTFIKIVVGLLFVVFGVYIFKMASDMAASNEVTQNLRIPFYPVAYAVGVCCFLECLVMLSDIIRIARGDYE